VHVWGTSMGGVVSTHLVVRNPEVVRSLIIEAPGAFRRGVRNPAELSPEEATRGFNSHPERVAWRKRTPPDPERWGLVVKIMGPDRDADLEARLGEISVPALVMFGVDDGIFSPASGETYRDNVPHCAYVLVEDAAHDLQGDQPEACAKLVREFLANGLALTDSQHDARITP
jgi:pimeloyl-ACP methyl ester carboxylesterase